jgi:hypothetical protein
MKKTFSLLFVIFMIASFNSILAQDIIDIPLTDGQSFELKSVIDADSAYEGNRTYRLERGGYYWVDGIIETKHPITIIGKEEPAELRPPVIIMATDETGTSPQQFIIANYDVTVKNLYVAGIDDGGVHKNFLETHADDIKVVVENCTFNYAFHWKGVFHFGSLDGTIELRDNVFMNILRGDGFLWSRVLYCNVTKIDTCIFTNNTVFNNSARVFDFGNNSALEPNYLLVDHNTFVNVGMDLSHSRWYMNTIYSNNILHNVLIPGDAAHTLSVGRADNGDAADNGGLGVEWAFIQHDTVETEMGTALYDSMLTALGQDYEIFQIYNNNFYQDPYITDTYGMLGKDPESGLDSANVPPILSQRAQGLFDDDENYPGLFIDDATTWQVDPGFTNDPTDLENLRKWIFFRYRKTNPTDFLLLPDGDDKFNFVWPVRGNMFDLTYSNSALVGNDGLHLGDLNWYPDERAQYQFTPVGVEQLPDALPMEYELGQNYPNPFNPTTNIQFSIPESGLVSLKVFDVLGQEVAQVINQELKAGVHKVDFNASQLTSGIYFYTLESGDFIKTQKMILLK